MSSIPSSGRRHRLPKQSQKPRPAHYRRGTRDVRKTCQLRHRPSQPLQRRDHYEGLHEKLSSNRPGSLVSFRHFHPAASAATQPRSTRNNVTLRRSSGPQRSSTPIETSRHCRPQATRPWPVQAGAIGQSIGASQRITKQGQAAGTQRGAVEVDRPRRGLSHHSHQRCQW